MLNYCLYFDYMSGFEEYYLMVLNYLSVIMLIYCLYKVVFLYIFNGIL